MRWIDRLINFLYKLISPRKKSGIYRFYKENSDTSHVGRRWYIDLPNYPGPKAALEMVCGADYLLDQLSLGTDAVVLKISIDAADIQVTRLGNGRRLELAKTEQTTYGRWYWYENHALWLCPVVVYVFGYYPETIYFKVL